MSLGPNHLDRIERALGTRVQSQGALSGGCIAEVYRLDLDTGQSVVAKVGDGHSGLDLEGRMLEFLHETRTVLVPEVFISEPDLLIMTLLDDQGRRTSEAETNLAESLAALHNVSDLTFGFREHTVIGGLHQTNPPMGSWIDFYREARLFAMADQAMTAGNLDVRDRSRLDRFANKLPGLISEPNQPELVHGDLWGGNIVIGKQGQCGLIDPAIYYGHGEMDLAFATLFNSVGEAFFQRYHEIKPIPPGFFEDRRDIYNLYPLLVHIRLFGGSYRLDFDRILKKFGC